MTAAALPPLPIALPLIAAALIGCFGKYWGRRVSDIVALLTAAANLGLCAVIFLAVRHAPIVYWFGGWWPRGPVALGIGFVIGPIGAVFAVLVCFLTLAALLFSWRIFEESENHFQPLMLLFMGAMCGFCYTGDLFNLFVFFELMSATAFALCGMKTKEPAPLQGSFNFAITNTVGAFLILDGIALLYARTGALNMAQIGRSLQQSQHADALVLLSFLLLATGYMVKAAIVPFHFWLVDAHAVAPTPVCVLFSGVMVELGLYAVARIFWTIYASPLAAHTRELRAIFLALGAVTAIFAALMCYLQHHLKRLLAFSTISHAGLMLMAIALFDAKAISGFALYAIGHGLVKGGLFLCAGLVLHHLEKIGENKLHGAGKGMVFTPALFILGALGLAAMPPFLLLAGDANISGAAKSFGIGWTKWIYLFAAAVTAAAVLRFTFRTFFAWGAPAPTDRASDVGELPETEQEHTHIPAMLFLPAAVLICSAMALLFVPQLRAILDSAATFFINQSAYQSLVIDGAPVSLPPQQALTPLTDTAAHNLFAALAALAIALLTVFTPWLRYFETGFSPIRKLHSGHPGDYIAWLLTGTAVIGGCFVVWLR